MDEFGEFETSLIASSGDAGGDVSNRDDTVVQTIGRDRLDYRRWDFTLEPFHHPDLDGDWTKNFRIVIDAS